MVEKVAGAAASTAAPPTAGAEFKRALLKAPKPGPTPQQGAPAQVPSPAKPEPTPRVIRNPVEALRPARSIEPGSRLDVAAQAGAPGASKALTQVQRAQARLDQLLQLAESGRTFSPSELLAFQAHAHRASLELDLAGKVVEKGTAAVKQTLQTQI